MNYIKIFEEILHLDTADKLIAALKKNNLWDDDRLWRYYGDVENNSSTVHGQQSQPVKTFVEKITNSIDAILVLECIKLGINPTDWENTPNTVNEAAELFVRNNKKFPISEKELEKRIYVYAEGTTDKGSKPTMCIYDDGEGQSPENVSSTILSLQKSNKNNIQFLQGQYNMGGTGAIRFCEQGLQFVLTKRNNFLNKNPKNLWSFTVVRREMPKKGQRNVFYTYLAPVLANEKPRKGDLMTFEKEEIALLPIQNKRYQVKKKSGTLIKCFGFSLKKRSNILFPGEFLSNIETMMPDCALPVRFAECRPFKGKEGGSFENTMVGLIKRLDRHGIHKETLEEGFPIRNSLNMSGNIIPIITYAFKRQKSARAKSNASSRRVDREGVIFTMNGQHYYDLPFTFYGRSKLQRIAQDLISIVDCSKLNNEMRTSIFMATKDNIAKTTEYYELEKQLETIFKNSEELKLLQNKRVAEESRDRTENNEAFDSLLSKLIENPALAALFGSGNRLSSAFNLQTAIDSKIEKKELKEYPSFFKFKKIDYGETLKKTASENKQINFIFETDVQDDYFYRKNNNGNIDIKFTGEKFKNERTIYADKLNNGIYKLTLSQPETISVGDLLNISFVVNDQTQNQPFVNTAEIKIVGQIEIDDDPDDPIPKPKPKPNKPEEGLKKEIPGGLSIPDPIWVTKEEWGNFSFDPFDEYDAMTVQFREESQLGSEKIDKYDYYINADNFYLLYELKRTKINLEIIKQRYKTAMTLIAVSILAQAKLENKDSEQTFETENKIREATRAISRVILPIIEVLGGLDDTTLILSD